MIILRRCLNASMKRTTFLNNEEHSAVSLLQPRGVKTHSGLRSERIRFPRGDNFQTSGGGTIYETRYTCYGAIEVVAIIIIILLLMT